jgi:ABC-type cobalamin/Fe3+-siderophores transport system ATPase subunit
MEGLGLDEEVLHVLRVMVARPEGVILITGPTGSGKTTTLYSLLSHLNTEGVNIMTLEDPVEYPMVQIRQTSSTTPCASISPAACDRSSARTPISSWSTRSATRIRRGWLSAAP